MAIDLTELRTFISDMYADVARFPRGGFHFPTGRPIMEKLGYPKEVLDALPDGALESFAGVGYHFDLDPLKAGEHVLDIGSGAGADACAAGLGVGDTGSVLGIDMTSAMLDKAKKNAEKAKLSHVRFELGHAEALPVDGGSLDCVISNGVINLTPDKRSVFDGIVTALRPGGRLMFSDIVTGVQLPPSVRDNCELWAECIGGAVQRSDYVSLMEDAGLSVETVRENQSYAFTQESTLSAAKKFRVSSVSILAYKR